MDFIAVYDGALSTELCQKLIKRFERSGLAEPGRTGAGVDPGKKISLDLTIQRDGLWEPLFDALMEVTFARLSEYWLKYYFGLIGAVSITVEDPSSGQPLVLTKDNFERHGAHRVSDLVSYVYRPGTLNLQKYEQNKGGYPHWHSENYPLDSTHEHLHRVLLFMFYLNDVTEGGETEFFYQNRSIKPTQGTMVIAPAGFTHTHRGLMPRSGDKYILTSWVLYNRAEKLYQQLG